MSTVINISTSSQVINYSPNAPNFPPAQLPVITINGNPIPAPPMPNTPTGFQVVVFDSSKEITDPTAIIANTCIPVFANNGNNWWNTYQYCYSGICSTLLTSGNIDEQTIIVASYGMDNNMAPTNDALQMLMAYGADGQLQYWETHCDAGSQVGNPTSWTAFPISYILFGASGWGYGNGTELYDSNSGTAKLAVTIP